MSGTAVQLKQKLCESTGIEPLVRYCSNCSLFDDEIGCYYGNTSVDGCRDYHPSKRGCI